MEIRIDTNKDSKEHIEQVIEFLQRFVGSQEKGFSAPKKIESVPVHKPAFRAPAEEDESESEVFAHVPMPHGSPVVSSSQEKSSEQKEKKLPLGLEIVPY
jgi:hypothetical protein